MTTAPVAKTDHSRRNTILAVILVGLLLHPLAATILAVILAVTVPRARTVMIALAVIFLVGALTFTSAISTGTDHRGGGGTPTGQ